MKIFRTDNLKKKGYSMPKSFKVNLNMILKNKRNYSNKFFQKSSFVQKMI